MGVFSVLKGVSLRVKKREFLGVVGPNGSGKSTLLRSILGIVTPDEGSVKVLGKDPFKDRSFLKEVGVVFGNKSGLWPYVPVRDSLKYIASLYGVRDADSRIKRISEELDASPLLSRLPRELSLGQRMKCELMAALVHDPSLLILDEPTMGLDVAARESFLQYLSLMNERGKTIVLVSHVIGDMDRSSRIVVMGNGRLVFDGTPKELKAIVNYRTIILHLSEPFGGKYVVKTRLKEGASVDDALKLFSSKGIKDFEVRLPSIEDVLVHLYRGMK